MEQKDVTKLVNNANRSEIARQTGIHLSHVSRVLSGKRGFSSRNLADIAKALGIDMQDLYTCLTKIRSRYTRQTAAA